MQYDRKITVSVGASRRSTSWQPQTLLVSQLWERLKTPVRGAESHAEYMAMRKPQQDDLKDIGGFVGGSVLGRRKKGSVTGRDVITLDLDNLPPASTGDVLKRVAGLGCISAIYSTRKHSPEAPRLRVLAVTDRTMLPEEYEPIARKLAQIIQPEMTWFDPTTYQPERLMYWPSASADGEYVFQQVDKPFLSADGMLEKYADWHDVQQWPQAPGEAKLRDRSITRQGDPEAKTGIVGAFCKTYDIPAAMMKFLPDAYVETDTPGRYTYTGGSTAGGAVLYDGGKFLYSHHATDPCSGVLVNAFDLVRLHRFGELDNADEVKENTPTNRLPSFKAMCDLVAVDPEPAAILKREAGERALADFRGIEIRQAPQPDTARYKDLSDFLGDIEKKDLSIRMVSDALDVMGITFRFEVVSRELELSGLEHLGWSRENATNNLPVYLRDMFRSAQVKGASTSAIQECLAVIADERRYNAVEVMLKSCAWDGADRIEILYEIMGISGDALSRLLVHKWLLQCVAMALNDENHPYGADGVLTLLGAQGIGKTSLGRVLGVQGAFFSEGLSIDFRVKDTVLRAISNWIVEFGEMEAMLRKSEETLKAFLTNPVDNERTPYARESTKRPRRTSYVGTVNSTEFLRDPTGSRRFWTVPLERIDIDRLLSLTQDWVVQLWAQVYDEWLRKGAQCFRLTPAERTQLEARNRNHAEQMRGEQEVLDLLDFDLPVEKWRWVSPAVVASFIGRATSSRGVGRILTKLKQSDDRVEFQRTKARKLYKIPLSETWNVP
ncbi:MAG: VapE domain-containing protein [Gemmiger sp.]